MDRNALSHDSLLIIDFAKPLPTQGFGNGFLLSTGVFGVSPRVDTLISVLAPKYWRLATSSELVLVSAHTNAEVDLGISGAYRTAFHRVDDWPATDSIAFQGWLSSFVRSVTVQPTYWEVWNEPNLRVFWPGTELQGNQVYCTTDRVLRSILGDHVLTVGPSLSRFDTSRIRRFANYAVSHGCKVNAFAWHELTSTTTPTELSKHVLWVHDSIVDNPAYAELGVSEIHLNETVPKPQRYSPGDLVAILRAARNANVNIVARSCWPEHTSHLSGCRDKSLDGLIDPTTQSPRASWWVYAAYASIRLAPVHALTPAGVYALAGRGGPRSAPLALIGRASGESADDSITIIVRGLRTANLGLTKSPASLDIVVRQIPWRGIDRPVESLPVTQRIRVKIADSTSFRIATPRVNTLSRFTLDPLIGSDAILLSVEPAIESPSSRFWPVWSPL